MQDTTFLIYSRLRISIYM